MRLYVELKTRCGCTRLDRHYERPPDRWRVPLRPKVNPAFTFAPDKIPMPTHDERAFVQVGERIIKTPAGEILVLEYEEE